MLKRLAIVGLLIFGLGGAWPQVPGHGGAQHDKAQDKQETTTPAKPVVAIESPAGANKQDHASEKPSQYPWKELLAPANIPNWFLVAVGAVTGWFVYKTLKAIKKQAEIMETQATEARESGERASLVAQGTLDALTKQAAVMEFQAGQMVNQSASIQTSSTAAYQSAEAAIAQIKMIKDKERARVAVEVLPLDTLEFGSGSNQVTLRINNFGYTHGDTHVTKFSYDKRISKWGEISQEGRAPIRHRSQWFKTIGSPDNEAT